MHTVFVRKRKKKIEECDGAMTSLGSVNGVGNATPASIAAMTGAEQCSPAAIGSGDNFGASQKIAVQGNKKKKE